MDFLLPLVFLANWMISVVLWRQAVGQLRKSRQHSDDLLKTCAQWKANFESMEQAFKDMERAKDNYAAVVAQYEAIHR